MLSRRKKEKQEDLIFMIYSISVASTFGLDAYMRVAGLRACASISCLENLWWEGNLANVFLEQQQVARPHTRPGIVPRREPLPAITAVDKDTLAVNVPLPPRRSPAIVAAVSVTSLANAPKPLKTSAPLVARSAISAAELVTSLEIALKVAATEVALAAAMAAVSRPATPAAVSATWPVTALMAKSATTAERSATYHATVPQRPRVSGFATTASNPATSRVPAPTTS
ncbi:hypothetical protein BDW62DRAFT_31137 [Aspergillus aurantiobrunneus]